MGKSVFFRVKQDQNELCTGSRSQDIRVLVRRGEANRQKKWEKNWNFEPLYLGHKIFLGKNILDPRFSCDRERILKIKKKSVTMSGKKCRFGRESLIYAC